MDPLLGVGVLPAALHPWKGGVPTASHCLQQEVGGTLLAAVYLQRVGVPYCCHPFHRGGRSLAAAATLHIGGGGSQAAAAILLIGGGEGSPRSHHQLYVEKWVPNRGRYPAMATVCEIKSGSLCGAVGLTFSLVAPEIKFNRAFTVFKFLKQGKIS